MSRHADKSAWRASGAKINLMMVRYHCRFYLTVISTALLVGLLIPTNASLAQEQFTATSEALQATLDALPPYSLLRLPARRYTAPLRITKPIILLAEPGAVLDANGQGDVLRIQAPDVTVKNLTIVNSGQDLTAMNAGIFVERTADRVTLMGNHLKDNAFGIWLDACNGPRILDNRIQGRQDKRSQDRGNGIHLYAVRNGEVRGNEVWETRDGIYIDTSQDNLLADNSLHHLRYGIHYMYSHSNQVINNSTYNTRTGYALMQSKQLTVMNNRSFNDSNYGILMNYITYSTLAKNHVVQVQEGAGYASGGSGIIGAEGKAIFIYNSQFNAIHDNSFSGSDIGIHLTAGSEDNKLYGNAFQHNRVQVKYVANRTQDWTHAGRGNYWSDYLGWDLNADGIGDKAYEPNDAVDILLWTYPMARLLMNSPPILTLRWVQEQFPVLKPQGVRDSAPLMMPPSDIQAPHEPPLQTRTGYSP